jgi:hypothetical protein
MAVLTRLMKLTGTNTPEPKGRTLRAGPVTAMFDNGALRYIKYGGIEVLRGIAYLARDKNWGTYAPAITGLKVKQSRSGFTVSYSALCKDAQQSLRYDARIEGKSDGSITFEATGTPGSDFLTNRTGFVVLHPLEGIVGSPVDVLHTDGQKEKRRFPSIISPSQPIFEIRSLTHQVMPGLKATVLMEGNKFEMEDHRNWMDASFKTYVCSLLDPWPYTLKKGESFTQKITLSFQGKPRSRPSAKTGKAIEVSFGSAKGKMPRFGVAVPMSEASASLAAAEQVAALRPRHLVCHIDGRNTGQVEAATAFRKLAEACVCPVTLEIVLPAKAPAHDEMAVIAKNVRAGGLRPQAVVVTQVHDLKSFQPNAPRPWGPSYEEMAAAARAEFPGAIIGGGMLSYFTELNRKPTPRGVFDFITHTVCPIVHAADDISVMETLEALPSIFASARSIIGKTPYHLGPSGIPCRDNPYGAAVASNPNRERTCLADNDPRQHALFAAAWNLGLATRAAEARLDSVTLGATTGPQGVILKGGALAPAFHVIAGLCAASGATRIEARSMAPSSVAALAHKTREGAVLWLANLSAEKKAIKISGLKGPVLMHTISEGAFSSAARDPHFLRKSGKKLARLGTLELAPYAAVRLAT